MASHHHLFLRGAQNLVNEQKALPMVERRTLTENGNGIMTAKTLIVATALLLGATSATLARGYGYRGAPYGYGGYGNAPAYSDSFGAPQYGSGVYDYAPGDGYGYRSSRGGPGPRFGNGTGAGIGAER
jgi:hypothetical protein